MSHPVPPSTLPTGYFFPDPAAEHPPQPPTLHKQLLQQLQPQLGQPQQQRQSSLLADFTADAATVPHPFVKKPYHSIRPHKKTRTGCYNCKARKVKCDETSPVCRSCKLRKVECVYPTPAVSASVSPCSTTTTTTLASPRKSTASNTPGCGSSPSSFSSPSAAAFSRQQALTLKSRSPLLTQPLWHPGNIDAANMKLLWFYTTSTSSSFSVAGPGNPMDHILKGRIVQVAFETPFLMDALFALSNLHMQNLNQNCDRNRAVAHQTRFLEGYRRAVESAAPETSVSVMAGSIFLTVLSSQVFREADGQELYILDWMVVWRGIGLIVDKMGIENVFDTGMHTLFERPAIDLDASTESIPNHLLFMVSSIKPNDPDYPDIATYHEALKYLGSLYMNLKDGFSPVMKLRIISWFTFLPRRFISLARQRRPRALVVIAYYATFLKLVKSIWWLKGVGERSLNELCNYLCPKWGHLLVVPQAARDVDDELDLARVIFQDPNWVPAEPHHIDSCSSITLVDDAGRRLGWTHVERKVVMLGSRASETVVWNR